MHVSDPKKRYTNQVIKWLGQGLGEHFRKFSSDVIPLVKISHVAKHRQIITQKMKHIYQGIIIKPCTNLLPPVCLF